MKKNKAHLGLTTVIIGGAFTLFASVGGAWVTGSTSAERQLGKIDTKVEVIKEREQNHYKELKEDNAELKGDIDEIKAGMQKLLQYNNIQ